VKEKKHKLHQQYISKVTGQEYPGGSTIANMLDKGFGMVGSAVKLTKAGLDYKQVWGEKRDAGSLVHERILQDLTGKEFDEKKYTGYMIERSNKSMDKYYAWKKSHKIKPIHCEKELISDQLRVGGTIDFIGEVDGKVTLIDYKSGGLYDSAFIQSAGYGLIAQENNIQIAQVQILNIPQTDDERFLEPILTDDERHIYEDIFIKLCNIYWLKSKLKEKK